MGSLFQRLRGWVGGLSPRTILLVGFGVFLIYAFPGFMSTDSVEQLAEARTGRFSDGHPPFMSAMWRVLDSIISGPLLMLLVQVGLFLGGLYSLLVRVMSQRAAAWSAILLLLFPPVLTPMAVIWKDSQMAAFLIAGTAGLVHPRRGVRLIGLALLVIACALRHNGLAAALPLVAILFEWRSGMSWWRRLAIVAGGAVIVVGLAFGLSRVLTAEHVKLTPAFSDIVGVIAHVEDKSDDELRTLLRGTPLVAPEGIQARARKLYALRGAFRITEGADRLFSYPANPQEWEALYRVWKELVLEHPGAYLLYHWSDFELLLGIPHDSVHATTWNLFLESPRQANRIQHMATWSRIQGAIGPWLYWSSWATPLFRPFVYVLLALALLLFWCRDRITLALFASGLLYELSYFPVGANPDYRYSHWMITCICVAAAVLIAQRFQRTAT